MGPDVQAHSAADRQDKGRQPDGRPRNEGQKVVSSHALVVRALAVLALAILALTPAAAKPPLQDPSSLPDPPGAGRSPAPLTGPGNFFRLPFIDEHQPVVVEDHDLPYWRAGTADPLLTNACRLGDFVSAPFNRMLARFTAAEGAAALQVVLPSHRHLLYDRRKLALPGQTYYFRDAGWPSCEVWVGGKVPPRRLDKNTGSSLPPDDRNAAKKKKAMIDSWPK